MLYFITAEAELNRTVVGGIVAGVSGLAILMTSLVIVVLSIAFIRRKSARFNITPSRDLSATNEGENILNIDIHGNDAYACTSHIQTSTNESYVTSTLLFPNQAYASVNMEEQTYASMDETGNNQTYASMDETGNNQTYASMDETGNNQTYASIDETGNNQTYTSIDETGNNQAYASINTEKETDDYVDVGGDPFNIHHTSVAGI